MIIMFCAFHWMDYNIAYNVLSESINATYLFKRASGSTSRTLFQTWSSEADGIPGVTNITVMNIIWKDHGIISLLLNIF